jgi:ferredoxin-NADP reductase
MNHTRTRNYSILFQYGRKEYHLTVKEVAVENDKSTYFITSNPFKGTLVQLGKRWQMTSDNIISERFKKQLVKEIHFHRQVLGLLDRAVLNTSILL